MNAWQGTAGPMAFNMTRPEEVPTGRIDPLLIAHWPAIVSSLNRPNDHRIGVVPSPGRHFNYRESSEAPLIGLGA